MIFLEAAFRTALALATIMVAGLGIIRLLARGEWIGGWTERLALAWLVGAGYITLGLFVFGFLFSGTALLVLLIAGAGGLFLAGRRQPWPPAATATIPLSPGEWFLIAVLAVEVVAIGWCAANFVLGWDGLAHWDLKAQIAFAHGGVLPPEYFQDTSRHTSHVRYPLGWAHLGTWLYLCLDRVDQGWVRILGAAYEWATMGLLAGSIARLGGQRKAGLAFAACLFLLPALTATPFGFFAGYADLPMGALYLAAVTRLPFWNSASPRFDVWLLAILGTLLVWTKSEGIVLLAALQVTALMATLHTGQWRKVPLWAIPAGLLVVGFSLYLRAVQAFPDNTYYPPSLDRLSAHADRIGPILDRFRLDVQAWQLWSLLWPGALLAVTTFAFRGRRPWAGYFTLLLLLPLPAYVFAYMLSAWPDYLRQVNTSCTRLVLQLAPTALLACGLGFSLCLYPSRATSTPSRQTSSSNVPPAKDLT